MDRYNEFITDQTGGIFQSAGIRKVKTPVIKSSHVIYGNPRKIRPDNAARSHAHQSNAFPLMDGDDVIGFVYECSCGEVTKILFDYEQEAERAAG